MQGAYKPIGRPFLRSLLATDHGVFQDVPDQVGMKSHSFSFTWIEFFFVKDWSESSSSDSSDRFFPPFFSSQSPFSFYHVHNLASDIFSCVALTTYQVSFETTYFHIMNSVLLFAEQCLQFCIKRLEGSNENILIEKCQK